MDLVIDAVTKKYANFSGRARRKEYWLYYLVYLIAYLILLAVDHGAGLVDPASLWVLGAAYGFGTAVTLLTLWFDDVAFHSYPRFSFRLKLAAYAMVEQLIYRQMTIVWRLWGIRLFLQGRTEWGQQVRKGFTTS